MEEWKKIKGYPNFEISNYGRVKSLPRKFVLNEKIMVNSSNRDYATIGIKNKYGYKTHKVHRLVAKHFVKGKTLKKRITNHIDGNKFNNHYSNLEWTDYSGNNKHAYRIGLNKSCFLGKKGKDSHSSKPVYQYSSDNKFIKKWHSMTEASVGVNRCLSGISSACINGWKCGNYRWYYKKLTKYN